jgi:hypothetical protein
LDQSLQPEIGKQLFGTFGIDVTSHVVRRSIPADVARAEVGSMRPSSVLIELYGANRLESRGQEPERYATAPREKVHVSGRLT